MKKLSGGVCAPKGFSANGLWCGIRKKADKRDLALIVSECDASAAGVCTLNLVKAASVLVTKAHLEGGKARAIVCNSGNANACTGEEGLDAARRMAEAAAGKIGCASELVLVGSTGVIGVPLAVEKIEAAMDALFSGLDATAAGHEAALEAIMTTDTRKKEAAVEVVLGGKTIRIGAMAKGSGMIHPNMGTMLCWITSDAAIIPPLLEKALRSAVKRSFNRVTVDGDTSTNDCVAVLANGLAENELIASECADYAVFAEALEAVCKSLAVELARDGEGATKLVRCSVSGADDEASAETLAKAVVSSSLVKAACFGADANWGRVLCALGYAGVAFDPASVAVRFASKAGELDVCRGGQAVPFSEEKAKKILLENEISILVDMRSGKSGYAMAWGCDLSYDYVRINGDYRS